MSAIRLLLESRAQVVATGRQAVMAIDTVHVGGPRGKSLKDVIPKIEAVFGDAHAIPASFKLELQPPRFNEAVLTFNLEDDVGEYGQLSRTGKVKSARQKVDQLVAPDGSIEIGTPERVGQMWVTPVEIYIGVIDADHIDN